MANKVKKINRKIILNCNKEKQILLQNPEIILNKMMNVLEDLIGTLGKKNMKVLVINLISCLLLQAGLKDIIEKQNVWPFLKLAFCNCD